MKEAEKQEDRPSEGAPRTGVDKDAAQPADPSPRRPVSGYVFKIAPADPKNSSNFEDVADK